MACQPLAAALSAQVGSKSVISGASYSHLAIKDSHLAVHGANMRQRLLCMEFGEPGTDVLLTRSEPHPKLVLVIFLTKIFFN